MSLDRLGGFSSPCREPPLAAELPPPRLALTVLLRHSSAVLTPVIPSPGPLLSEPSEGPDVTSAAAVATVSWVTPLELMVEGLYFNFGVHPSLVANCSQEVKRPCSFYRQVSGVLEMGETPVLMADTLQP